MAVMLARFNYLNLKKWNDEKLSECKVPLFPQDYFTYFLEIPMELYASILKIFMTTSSVLKTFLLEICYEL